MARQPVLVCSEATRLLVRADAQAEGVNMPILTDKYIHAGRKIYRKSIKHDRKSKKKQEVANV
jgi:hypothetical protein